MNMISMGNAHPNDLLILDEDWQRVWWPEFNDRQVFLADDASGIAGFGPRKVWVSSAVFNGKHGSPRLRAILDIMEAGGVQVRPLVLWEPEPEPTLGQRILDWVAELTRGRK